MITKMNTVSFRMNDFLCAKAMVTKLYYIFCV